MSAIVIVRVGEPLQWIEGTAMYEWWKTDGSRRTVPDDGPIHIDDLPGSYCYSASEWRTPQNDIILVFHCFH